ncbi:MAG TPA: low molecular weight protein-tyrosine-phosphatase [Pseudoxanthomonas sp.]|nr:low molecular weight protein-tyrosine-phosphatase [Pseudoxanthomonas sp.]
MTKRILIVCKGNICRSPMAEIALRGKLEGNGAVRVESAGLAAMVGHPIDPSAARILAMRGLDGSAHVARQIDIAQIRDAHLVLAMERRQLVALQAMAPRTRSKTFLLGEWNGHSEIPDPYGRSDDMFEGVFSMIESALDGWMDRM